MLLRFSIYYLVFFLFILTQELVSAQTRVEIKTDLFDLPSLDPSLFLEISGQKRWAFSIGTKYTFTKQFIQAATPYRTSFGYLPGDRLHFKWQYISISPAIRFYFSKEKKNYGWYSGISNTTQFNTYQDPAYFQMYKEIRKFEFDQHRIKEFFIGLPGGYKWLLLEDKLSLEIALMYGIQASWWTKYNFAGFDFKWDLKIGYRFPIKN